MTTTELNSYLRTNVKCKQGNFLNGSHLGDSYSSLRDDASIYCWSGMNSVTNQVGTNSNYCNWMQSCARQLSQNESKNESESNILVRAIHCVRNDGDDWCDEQSVGWYLAVYTYMHCLAYNVTSFEALFLKFWRLYFTESYQRQIRASL